MCPKQWKKKESRLAGQLADGLKNHAPEKKISFLFGD